MMWVKVVDTSTPHSSQSQNSRVSAEDFHHLLRGLRNKNPVVDASKVFSYF
jgi:hypothetical protein